MLRNFWVNAVLGTAFFGLLVKLVGSQVPVGELTDETRTRIAEAGPSLERAAGALQDVLTVVELVLLLAIGFVLYVSLVRSGRVHAPWFAAHVVAPLEAWRRRYLLAAERTSGPGEAHRGEAGQGVPPGQGEHEGKSP